MVILNIDGSTCRLYGDILSDECSCKIEEFIDSFCDNGGFNIVQDFDRISSIDLDEMLSSNIIGNTSIRIDIKVGENFVISKFGKIFRK
ncbi:hypothetical protein [Proteus phage PM2]|uniref:Uncharacterized protein n=2 Tax=Bragavirus TaxID=2948639 RepID=A0A0G2SSR0_9CAUD|nr:hypothetical protein AVT59_gp185 [Proteus phage vB_PmiM_Pm5461]YP_010092063.1 hypothetical protein KNT71_gp177 [Proteus phage PM2]AKA62052.1 hypothetical protein Pm5461_186 [Proteus phage vB_PmiM_Pm5461]ASZ76455.1 hypothetical protein [Proteus phage PM2]